MGIEKVEQHKAPAEKTNQELNLVDLMKSKHEALHNGGKGKDLLEECTKGQKDSNGEGGKKFEPKKPLPLPNGEKGNVKDEAGPSKDNGNKHWGEPKDNKGKSGFDDGSKEIKKDPKFNKDGKDLLKDPKDIFKDGTWMKVGPSQNQAGPDKSAGSGKGYVEFTNPFPKF